MQNGVRFLEESAFGLMTDVSGEGMATSGWLNLCAAEQLPDRFGRPSPSASALLAKCAEHFGAIRE